MRRALERAVGFEDVHLSPPQFIAASERLVLLQAQAFDLSSAIATFERLRDLEGMQTLPIHAAAIANLQPTYDDLRALVNGDHILEMKGSVGEFDYWVHNLIKTSFSVANVSGRLDALDIRCDRGT